jgi:formylglycine-generating enzyme required for sulfatase activity
MKIPLLPAAVLAAACLASSALAAPPVVSNVRAAQLAGTKNVEILYDVSDADGGTLTIGVEMSGDGGATYTIPATALSGHVGPGVAPGLSRRIVWNAGADWNQQHVPNARARVTAFDGTTPVPPPGMVYIPAGTFQMGDNLDGQTESMPVHTVTTNAYFMDRYEVTGVLWETVRTWALANGYSIGNVGYRGASHPVQSVIWFDAVKWCNARSRKEGLTPVYYTDDGQTIEYKSVENWQITNAQVKWAANGYRLPTEAEWEKAARAGTLGQRFPWGSNATHAQANYYASPSSFAYDVSPTSEFHPTYRTGNSSPSTSPAGAFAPNNYGLYDMGGNVWEWCWDWHGSTFYGDPSAGNNPRGPATGSGRILRGASFDHTAYSMRCAGRISNGPSNTYYAFGFRCVRGL